MKKLFLEKNGAIPKLETEILSLEINFYCSVDISKYNLGGVYLEREGRKYVFNISNSSMSENNCTISCDLEINEHIFPLSQEHPYTLTDNDLNQNNGLEIEVHIGCEWEEEPESITLFVKRNDCTIALDAVYC